MQLSMARRRNDSTTSGCSSEGEGGEGRRPVKTAKRRSRRNDSSPRRSRSTDRPRSYRPVAEEPRGSIRTRSRSPPRDSRRDYDRDASRSRSRSRSRSSTPARYEAHMRSLGIFGRPPPPRHGEWTAHDSRGGFRHHPHLPHHGPRGGAGYRGGGYRPGFVRSRDIYDGRDDPRPSHCLGVFGMPPWMREEDMRGMFEPFGEVSQLNVVMNHHTGECRGYGFVYYKTVDEAKKARVAMQDAKIDGIPIRVDYSLTEKGRPSYKDNL
ncbi:hypothetical protein PENTCL1PPCAC_12190 [Pristionchus entomophagus]|uniref:RRM domain-containing protein n=1 Tax=Pristionchus entomophagus TaxID=358040 RepID=A0AAV5TC82_9BILA|nr:hypothetical protein PENTCL1PPCAC_12190 [Pristionchus entomophagus]